MTPPLTLFSNPSRTAVSLSHYIWPSRQGLNHQTIGFRFPRLARHHTAYTICVRGRGNLGRNHDLCAGSGGQPTVSTRLVAPLGAEIREYVAGCVALAEGGDGA